MVCICKDPEGITKVKEDQNLSLKAIRRHECDSK